MANAFIQHQLTGIQQLMQQHHIRKAYLFGSAVNGKFHPQSDVDFLVEPDETLPPAEMGNHLWNLTFELERLLGRKVDLLTARALRNPFFKEEVEETKELIYG